jgi:hypothetical protein
MAPNGSPQSGQSFSSLDEPGNLFHLKSVLAEGKNFLQFSHQKE